MDLTVFKTFSLDKIYLQSVPEVQREVKVENCSNKERHRQGHGYGDL